MFIFQKSLEGIQNIDYLKNKIDTFILKNKIDIKEKIFIGYATGNYIGSNIYYCNKKSKKIATFLKDNALNFDVKIRCFSFLKSDEYDIKIEIGYIENSNEQKYIENAVKNIFLAIEKTYFIINKGYYFPIE